MGLVLRLGLCKSFTASCFSDLLCVRPWFLKKLHSQFSQIYCQALFSEKAAQPVVSQTYCQALVSTKAAQPVVSQIFCQALAGLASFPCSGLCQQTGGNPRPRSLFPDIILLWLVFCCCCVVGGVVVVFFKSSCLRTEGLRMLMQGNLLLKLTKTLHSN